MAREASPQERVLGAQLTRHPQDHAACGGCIFYESRTDGEGYCSEPRVCLNVASSWWCKFHERNESKIKVTGHPFHPALIPLPVAGTALALIFDVLAQTTGRPQWRREARHALVAGTVGGLLAGPVGLMDWLSLPAGRPAKVYGMVHGLGNLAVLGINGVNAALRSGDREPSAGQRVREIGLSILAATLVVGTGWLGRQLAYRFGVGVETPMAPYHTIQIEPVVRLSDEMEWRDGSLKVPAEPFWNGPAIPSEPLPPSAEERLAAS